MQSRRASLITWLLSLFVVALFAGRPAFAREYVIAPGDSLNVTVVGEDAYGGAFTVNEDGRISIKNVGGVVAAGKTADQLKAELTQRLKALFKDPVVIVDITSASNAFVWITGGVVTPRQIKVVPGARVSYYLREAGGLADSAERGKGSIVRPGADGEISLDLDAILRGTDPSKDVEVAAGDTIYVPKKVDGKIKVLGEVKTPGDQVMRDRMTPMEAITSAAGGFLPTADKSKVTVQHKDGTRVTVDLEAESRGEASPLTANLFLQEGDLIYVPNDENSRVDVDGMGIKNPGKVSYESGMRVMDAILKSGNFTDDADRETVSIHRKTGQPITVDLDKYVRERDMSQNVPLEKGDRVVVGVANADSNQVEVSGLGVKTPGRVPYDNGMRVLDAITKAGGFVERARVKEVAVVRKDGKPVQVNMEKYLNSGDMSQNVPLQKGDTVLVGLEKEKTKKSNWLETVLPSLATAVMYGAIYR